MLNKPRAIVEKNVLLAFSEGLEGEGSAREFDFLFFTHTFFTSACESKGGATGEHRPSPCGPFVLGFLESWSL